MSYELLLLMAVFAAAMQELAKEVFANVQL